MKILIIDNYDSFTYNLFHMVEAVMPAEWTLSVARNDEILLEEVNDYDKIIISPGPGLPKDAGISLELIQYFAGEKSILGVCLGHQAIAEAFGGKLKNLDRVLHGVSINTRVVKGKDYLFANCPETFETGRYHSWVADPQTLPESLEVIAMDEPGHIMAIRHKEFDIRGVQFHPESIMTPIGSKILENWVRRSQKTGKRKRAAAITKAATS